MELVRMHPDFAGCEALRVIPSSVWTLALIWLAACQAPPGNPAAAADGASVGTPIAGAAVPQDSTAQATIPVGGGSLELPGIATVRFPPGAFANAQTVTLAATRSEETALDFETTVPVPTIARGAYELRILTGSAPPQDSVEVIMRIPDEVRSAVAQGGALAAFAQIWQSGGQELLDGFVRVPVIGMSPDADRIRLRLDPVAFTDRRRADRQFEAIVVIAATRRR
jgi:hypothetical protein